jgi:hypothetical protein
VEAKAELKRAVKQEEEEDVCIERETVRLCVTAFSV